MQRILVKKSLRSSEKFRGLLNYPKWLLNKDKYESVFFFILSISAQAAYSPDMCCEILKDSAI